MYGDLEINIFRVCQTKGILVRRQLIDVKFFVMACKRYTSTSENETCDFNVKQKVLYDEKR